MSGEYLDYIAADRNYAAELAASGSPVCIVHAEKGDGELSDLERASLEVAANVTLVTVPGAGFLLPDGPRTDCGGDCRRSFEGDRTSGPLSLGIPPLRSGMTRKAKRSSDGMVHRFQPDIVPVHVGCGGE